MVSSNHFLNLSRSEAAKKNSTVVSKLSEKLTHVMGEVVPKPGKYAILDFPNHQNIGDSAIYAGEAKLCREYFGRSPSLVTETSADDLLRVEGLDSDTTLFLHGGGNFGDIYDKHQNFRNAILKKFPRRKVIMMPQSIHFNDLKNIYATVEAINNHTDFTMMVRDEFSFEFAKKYFDCEVKLVPDMAFALGPLTPSQEADVEALALIREDVESVSQTSSALADLTKKKISSLMLDWPREPWERKIANRFPRNIRGLLSPRMQHIRPVTPNAFEWLANRRLQTGLNILSRGEVVITDRLHAHILCILLGIPHFTLDNTYKKIERYSEVWTKDCAFLSLNDSYEFLEHIC